MIKNTFFFSKKAVSSITTFSLIIILLLSLFISVQNYTNNSKKDIIYKNQELEVLNSILSFRTNLINIISSKNNELIYSNPYDIKSDLIYLNDTSIIGEDLSLNKPIYKEISSLGIKFCSNYTFYPIVNTKFNFNGSCVKIITN